MNKIKHKHMSLFIILLMLLSMQLTLADQQPDKDNTYLHVVRDQLSLAVEQYNNGDIAASKESLKKASLWLNKAVNHSKYDTISAEANRMASEIESFRHTLSDSSEHNDLVRFWHQATSLVISESERLIHSYVQSSNDNTILKHLLDAKMHFFLAEHDLFVGHEPKDALHELNDSLEYLEQANEIAKKNLQVRINDLINRIKVLRTSTEASKNYWEQSELVSSLDKAINNIIEAEAFATPPDKLKLQLVEQRIDKIKLDLQKTNLKAIYDSIMVDFALTIKNI